MTVHYKKDKAERVQFYFHNDDIERCIKGTRRKWIKSRPNVPKAWPIKIGANLTRKETLVLENACFQLPQGAIMLPRRLYGSKVPFDMALYPSSICPYDHPNTTSSKNIRRKKKAPTTKYYDITHLLLT
jgi:hypothetical protein